MKTLSIDHIAIIVKDIQAALPFYCDTMQLAFEGIEKNTVHNVDIAMLRCGDVLFELLEPTGAGIYKEILEQKGEGFHHIAFLVEDIERSLEYIKAGNIPLVNEKPVIGGGGALIAFLQAASANNVSIEIIER